MWAHLEALKLQDERKAQAATAAALPQGPDDVAADAPAAKAHANALFTRGAIDRALIAYEHAIKLCSSAPPPAPAAGAPSMLAVLYANVAACHVHHARWSEALLATDASLAESPDYTKAAFRRVQALKGLRQHAEAIEAAAAARASTDDKKVQTQLDELAAQACRERDELADRARREALERE
eukprot:6113185-Prymnesium_polylepis.1